MTQLTVEVLQEGDVQVVDVLHEGPRGPRGVDGAGVNADWNATSGAAQILNKPVLGGAALLNVGTTTGTVAAGDDARITGALSAATAASTYQPLDADLTSIAALTTTTFGRSLLTQADAPATRSTLGLGSLAPLSALGNITSAGAIGSTPTLPIITTTGGVLTTGAFGTTAGTFCQGNDSRLSDARTPTAHNQAWSTITGTPTTLSEYGITDAQPLDADLTAIAALTTTAFGRSQLTLADAAAGTAQLNVFTSTLKGLAPASGGGTTTFLRADGTWATPAGSGNVSASGTPSAGQAAEWASATTIQGVAVTGSGSYVKATSPTLVTPALGTPSAVVLTNGTGLPLTTGVTGILPTANGGTGVDNSTGGTANTVWARPNGATGAASYRALVAADIPALPSSTISDFDASTRAQVEATLIAGTNVTITPGSSGATRTLTIAASGGGGGGSSAGADLFLSQNFV